MPGLPKGQRTIHEMLPGPLRSLANMVFPEDDPQGMMPAPGGPAMVRMPREAGMKVLENVRTLPSLSGFSQEAVSALTQLQSKYPRMFGHVSGVSPDVAASARPSGIAGWFGELRGASQPTSAARGTSHISIAPGMPREQILETGAHELTHAAQHLRNPRGFGTKYSQATKALGYKQNPYEVRAREAGKNFAERTLNPRIK